VDETRYRMRVDGMTCESCERHAKGALGGAGADEVDASWRRGEATFSAAASIDRSSLSRAVREAGYTPGEIWPIERAPGRVAGADGEYDLLIIGSGGAAFAAAIRASNLDARVALVEREVVGGTCVNIGCIPSKTLLAAAGARHTAAAHPFAGIETTAGDVDLAALVAQKDELTSRLRQAKYLDLADSYGFEVLRGEATFVSPDTVSVEGRELRAGAYLVATGADPRIPDLPGLREAGYLTSTTAMEQERVPRRLAVIGGGFVGMEQGQLFARLGAAVTIVGRLAPRAEPELGDWMSRAFADEGIEVRRQRAVAVEASGRTKLVVLDDGSCVEADAILVATGRAPRTAALGLERAGVAANESGAIVTDNEQRTSNPRVYAAGDVTAGHQFVYVAAAQGNVAAENAVAGSRRTMDYTGLPSVIFTSPQMASAGMTEAQALEAGYECDCRVLDLADVPRALVQRDTTGAIKIVAQRGTGKVLGVHAVAEGAGDMILAGVYAVKFGLTVSDLANTWAPYLTMSEGLKLAAQTFSRDVKQLSCCAA
jgi:mercuric reductase